MGEISRDCCPNPNTKSRWGCLKLPGPLRFSRSGSPYVLQSRDGRSDLPGLIKINQEKSEKSRGIKKCRDNLNFPQFLDSTRPFSFNFEGFQEQCLLLIMKILTIPIILVLKVGENREVR